MKHEDREDTVLYLRVPKSVVADIDRWIEREYQTARKTNPYARRSTRSTIAYRAFIAYLVEVGFAKGSAA